MPLSVHDDAETALLNLSVVFDNMGDWEMTGAEVAKALREVAAMLHDRRKAVQQFGERSS